MKTVREIFACVLLAATIVVAVETAVFVRTANQTIADLPARVEKVLNALPGQVVPPVIAEVDKQAMAIVATADARLGSMEQTADTRLGSIEDDVDTMGMFALNAGLAEVDATRKNADQQLAFMNITLRGGLTAIANTSLAANDLLNAYAALPDRVYQSQAWRSMEPEITCRHDDGTGYGGCMRSRINGMLGEAVNIGGVFTKRFPEFSGSVNGIAADVHTFTSRAVAPRGFWGTFKDFLTTGSGITRALGSAGLFETQIATPKQ